MGKLVPLVLSAAACVCGMQDPGVCQTEIYGLQPSDGQPAMSASLLQSEVAASRAERRQGHWRRQRYEEGSLLETVDEDAKSIGSDRTKFNEFPQVHVVSADSHPDEDSPSGHDSFDPLKANEVAKEADPIDHSASDLLHGVTDEHHHHSIFKLRFSELDKDSFWLILLCMLAFTIVVDRLEFWAGQFAEHDMARQMYLNRLNAELMMFGLVSTVVFVSEQFWEPTPANTIIFEFVDIFCSMGACGLLLSCLVLFMLHRWMERRWKYFGGRNHGSHLRQAQRMQFEHAAASKLLQEALTANSLQEVDVEYCEYCIMSARFKRSQELPDAFDYSEYLKLCLTDTICDLMNISWISWLVVLSFTLLLYGLHHLYGPHSSDGHVNAFCTGVWILAIFHILVLLAVMQARKIMTQGLGCDSLQTLQDSLRVAVQEPTSLSISPVKRLNDKVVLALQQTIQLISLATSFQGSYLIMHVFHNVQSTRWRLALIVPIVIDTVVLLPAIISYFTVIKAYYSPEHEVVDSTLEWSTKLEEDLNFVSKQFLSKDVLAKGSREKLRDTLLTTSQEAFRQSIIDMGLHIGKKRAFRIYRAFVNDDGKVDPNELMDALIGQNSAASS